MALIKCPECGNDCSDKAAACPRCGYPFSEQAAEMAEPLPLDEDENEGEASAIGESNKKDDWTKTMRVLAAVAIVGILGMILAINISQARTKAKYNSLTSGSSYTATSPSTSSSSSYTSSSSSGKKYSDEEYEVAMYLLSKKAVSNHLKAPSTAKFCKQSECTFKKGDGNTFSMAGWVDAQNSYGASIRQVWAVTAEQDGDALNPIVVTIGDSIYFS